MNIHPSVKDLVGPWSGEATTSLMQRCKAAWETPLRELSDLMVATFIEQELALPEMIKEGRRRIELAKKDDTELFDGQLFEAVMRAESSNNSLQARRP